MANLELAKGAPSEKPATGTPVKAANEDTPTGGALYRLISRRPSKNIPLLGFVAAMLTLGVWLGYVNTSYGLTSLATLPQPQLTLILAAVLVPLLLIVLTTWTIWRGQEMHLMADALARTAVRLTDPADAASGEIATIANLVEAEINRMKMALAEAVDETARLRVMVDDNLESIEQGGTRAEMRAVRMEELLTNHHDSMTELGRMIGQESDLISRGLRGQVEAVRGLIGQAEKTLNDAGNRVVAETETLSRVSEAARAGADSTASTLDRQASRLEVVANTALSKADDLTTRYETQRQILTDAANNLTSQANRLEALFESHRDHMAEAGDVVTARTKEISDAAQSLAQQVTTTFDSAAERAKTLHAEISGEVTAAIAEVSDASGTISRSTGAATRAIGATIDELREAAKAVNEDLHRATIAAISATTDDLRIATNAMTSEVTRAASALTENVSMRTDEMRGVLEQTLSENDVAAERFNAAMIRLGGTAREAGNALDHAAADLEARMALLPEEAAASAAALTVVLQDQITALAAIADIVVRHARVLDRSSPQPIAPPTPTLAPTLAPTFAAAPPPTPARLGDGQSTRGWGIPDLLAAAGRHAEQSAQPLARKPQSDSEFHRTSLQVIETLQALAIDLNQALEESPSPELWQRYQDGERNVFARRLYNMAGRQLYDRIAVKYRGEEEFKENVDRFVDLFEKLLEGASARDRDKILVETYLTSDTGKVYLILAQANGRLT